MSQAPSVQSMVIVFGACARLRETTLALDDQSEAISFLATNVGIMASRAVSDRGVFFALAREMGDLAGRIKATVAQMRKYAETLAPLVLAGQERARQAGKLRDALAGLPDGPNRVLTLEALNLMESPFGVLAAQTVQARTFVGEHLATLERLCRRLDAVAAKYRVEAARCDGDRLTRVAAHCRELDAGSGHLRELARSNAWLVAALDWNAEATLEAIR